MTIENLKEAYCVSNLAAVSVESVVESVAEIFKKIPDTKKGMTAILFDFEKNCIIIDSTDNVDAMWAEEDTWNSDECHFSMYDETRESNIAHSCKEYFLKINDELIEDLVRSIKIPGIKKESETLLDIAVSNLKAVSENFDSFDDMRKNIDGLKKTKLLIDAACIDDDYLRMSSLDSSATMTLQKAQDYYESALIMRAGTAVDTLDEWIRKVIILADREKWYVDINFALSGVRDEQMTEEDRLQLENDIKSIIADTYYQRNIVKSDLKNGWVRFDGNLFERFFSD